MMSLSAAGAGVGGSGRVDASNSNPYAAMQEREFAVVQQWLARASNEGAPDLSAVGADIPRDKAHGEIALNGALVLARTMRRAPMELAEELCAAAQSWPEVARAETAKPGFVNLTLKPEIWQAELRRILVAGEDYARGRKDSLPPVSLEYVSANPTGPLHVGHARGAVVGDVLANLLVYAGHKVSREYYINDVGGQMDALGASVLWRLRELKEGTSVQQKEGHYGGEYLVELAKELAPALPSDFWAWEEARRAGHVLPLAVEALMAQIREDLAALGIRHDVFISEQELRQGNALEDMLQQLSAKGLTYEGVLPPPKSSKGSKAVPTQQASKLPQLLFRARQLGDVEDRALQRPDGTWTYFAADIACHRNKRERGFAHLINIWGADHGGYVKRLALALRALYGTDMELDVKLCHLVRLIRDGAQVKMSKRGGEFISLRELLDEVGKDVLRFIMLTRKNDAPLDFDFTLVTQKSKENPVFYVQYAHTRICSVLRNAEAQGWDEASLAAGALAEANLTLLTAKPELALLRQLAAFPRMLAGAIRAHEPHRLAFYAYELAACLHVLWSEGKENSELRFLHEDKALTRARLALLYITGFILRENLSIMGITPQEEMR